jgi:hypothetical protein
VFVCCDRLVATLRTTRPCGDFINKAVACRSRSCRVASPSALVQLDMNLAAHYTLGIMDHIPFMHAGIVSMHTHGSSNLGERRRRGTGRCSAHHPTGHCWCRHRQPRSYLPCHRLAGQWPKGFQPPGPLPLAPKFPAAPSAHFQLPSRLESEAPVQYKAVAPMWRLTCSLICSACSAEYIVGRLNPITLQAATDSDQLFCVMNSMYVAE